MGSRSRPREIQPSDILSLEDVTRRLSDNKQQAYGGYDSSQDDPVPQHWLFACNGPQVYADGKNICKDLYDIIKKAPDNDTCLRPLAYHLSKLSEYRLDMKLDVAFIGPMGVGKSALINALLDAPNLSKTGAFETVIHLPIIYEVGRTEPAKNVPGHFPTTTCVFFRNTDEMEALATMMKRICLAWYRDQEEAKQEATDETDDEPDDESEVGDAEEHGNDFCCVDEWVRCVGVLAKKSEEEMTDMISRTGIEYLDQKIVKWTEEALHALRPDLTTAEVKAVEFSASYIHEQENKMTINLDVKSWRPLINEIDVKCHNAPMLHHGLRLVDLPGFGNLDPFLSHITASYGSRSAAFVVVGTTRHKNDGAFRRKVRECLKVVDDPSKIFIVLTHKDHYKSSDIDKYLKGAKDPIGARVRELYQEQERKKAEKKRNHQKLGASGSDSDDDVATAKSEYLDYLRQVARRARAQLAEESLRDWAKQEFGGGKGAPRLHLVSAAPSCYEAGKRPTRFSKLPFLLSQECGIPGLRAELRELPAQDASTTLKTYIFHSIPSAIKYARLATGDGTGTYVPMTKNSFANESAVQFEGHADEFAETIHGMQDASTIVEEKGRQGRKEIEDNLPQFQAKIRALQKEILQAQIRHTLDSNAGGSLGECRKPLIDTINSEAQNDEVLIASSEFQQIFTLFNEEHKLLGLEELEKGAFAQELVELYREKSQVFEEQQRQHSLQNKGGEEMKDVKWADKQWKQQSQTTAMEEKEDVE
ncbi:hypothetical protein N0V83_010832 [Neocucurbitaria cava]|uniref:Uncharacterized protein n=1 Tax=Neocucurbitaria cava TaxID=798079 RepID=A0A9W9CH79_9PLEO|nr:hypothetical protein N0V83_010832 [Neocucurbitaria cava]